MHTRYACPLMHACATVLLTPPNVNASDLRGREECVPSKMGHAKAENVPKSGARIRQRRCGAFSARVCPGREISRGTKGVRTPENGTCEGGKCSEIGGAHSAKAVRRFLGSRLPRSRDLPARQRSAYPRKRDTGAVRMSRNRGYALRLIERLDCRRAPEAQLAHKEQALAVGNQSLPTSSLPAPYQLSSS